MAKQITCECGYVLPRRDRRRGRCRRAESHIAERPSRARREGDARRPARLGRGGLRTRCPSRPSTRQRVQGDDARAVAGGRGGLAPLGAVPRGVARRGDRADARPGRGRRGLARARHRGRCGRADARGRAAGRRDGRGARDRHLGARSSSTPRRGARGRARERRRPGRWTARSSTSSRVVRRGDLAARADVPARTRQAALDGGAARRSGPGGRYAAIVFAEPERNALLLGADRDHPPPRGAAAARAGPAGAVQLHGARRAARGRGLHRRRGAPRRGAASHGVGGGVHPARAGVVRRAPPDARRPRRGRAGGDLGGGRGGARASSRAPAASSARASSWSARGHVAVRPSAARGRLPAACT